MSSTKSNKTNKSSKSNKSSRKSNGNKKKRNTSKQQQQQSGTIFDSLLDHVSVATLAGLGVTLAALTASAMLIRQQKNKASDVNVKTGRATPHGPHPLMYAKSAPVLPRSGGTRGGPVISVEQVSKMFQKCLSAQRPKDQKIMMEQFYLSIRAWDHDMLNESAQTIIVNFLFWYYRVQNSPLQIFTPEQADHIRYWADYDLKMSLDWSTYNLKFDFMYSAALLQRSIPHMKQFYKFVLKSVPRAQPADLPNKKKDNYSLTRFQAANILGHWKDVKSMGQVISRITAELGWRSPKDNYLLNYALRAMDMPQSNANFGQMFKIVDKLISDFPTKLMPPPRFGKWTVHSYKYRNRNKLATPTDDSKFVVSSLSMKDENGWYNFYPPRSRSVSMARIPKEVKLWGRLAQMMSPMNGLSGCLPMTGTWSETQLYMEMEWTFRADSTHDRLKHGVFEVEREPIEETVIKTDLFGGKMEEKGYKWRGTLTVTITDQKEELIYNTKKLLGLSNGNAISNGDIRSSLLTKEENKEPSDNNDTTSITTRKKQLNDTNDDSNSETVIYDVELVIETDLEESHQKPKTPKGILVPNGNTSGNKLNNIRPQEQRAHDLNAQLAALLNAAGAAQQQRRANVN